MNVIEETIDATLESNGQLRLTHQPRLPPGPVRVTIRSVAAVGPRRGMADVIQEIDADQRLRGFHGRTAAELEAEEESRQAEDDERDREQDAARGGSRGDCVLPVRSPGTARGPSQGRPAGRSDRHERPGY
jgi:hypothetical protein